MSVLSSQSSGVLAFRQKLPLLQHRHLMSRSLIIRVTARMRTQEAIPNKEIFRRDHNSKMRDFDDALAKLHPDGRKKLIVIVSNDAHVTSGRKELCTQNMSTCTRSDPMQSDTGDLYATRHACPALTACPFDHVKLAAAGSP